MVHTYDITGMHCHSCVAKVTAALQRVPGVTAAQVSLNPPQARVEMSSHVPTEQLDRAAQSTGAYHLADAPTPPAPGEAASAAGRTTPNVPHVHVLDLTAPPANANSPPQESLYPLFLIVGYILGIVALVAILTGERSPMVLMRYFMSGFFLVFSFFKLLDLRGFATTYRTYDILARAVPAWAYAYPFVELVLGAAYLLDLAPLATNLATLAVMLLGAVGVLQALRAKRAIRCACLGTALNLPMTTITLVEDLVMATMAAIMLFTG